MFLRRGEGGCEDGWLPDWVRRGFGGMNPCLSTEKVGDGRPDGGPVRTSEHE